MTTNDAPPPVPVVDPAVLADVSAIIGGAYARVTDRERRAGLYIGWRREPYRPTRTGGSRRPGGSHGYGVTLTQALYLSAQTRLVDDATTYLAYACVAMAVELRLGRPAHELLTGGQADEYLDPHTSDERLHELDVIVLDEFNAHHATGADDVQELLAIAAERAPEVIAAQVDAMDLRAADDALDLVPLSAFGPARAAG